MQVVIFSYIHRHMYVYMHVYIQLECYKIDMVNPAVIIYNIGSAISAFTSFKIEYLGKNIKIYTD